MAFPLYWADTHSRDVGNGRSLWRLDTPVVPYWCDLWSANAPTVIFTRLHLKSNWGSFDLSVHREQINNGSLLHYQSSVLNLDTARGKLFSVSLVIIWLQNTIVCDKITIVITVVIFRWVTPWNKDSLFLQETYWDWNWCSFGIYCWAWLKI